MSGRNATRWSVFSIGFLSIGFQIILVRMLLVQFHGMELPVMMALALWIGITGIGAVVARWFTGLKNRRTLLLSLLFLLPLLVLISPPSVRFLSGMVIPYGSYPAVQHVLLITLIAEGPFCLLSGFLFVMITGQSDKKEAASIYAFESGGGAISGFLVNAVLIWLVDLHICVWIISLLSGVVIIHNYQGSIYRKLFYCILATAGFLAIFWLYSDLDSWLEQWNYKGQRIIFRDSNPYGSVTMTQTGSQLNIYENGNLLFSSGSVTNVEEDVHYALAQRPEPESVLLISGGFPGILNELQKYKPKEITFLELNPSLVYLAKQVAGFGQYNNLKISNMDVRRFLRSAKRKFDVILILVAPPDNLDLNLFYTDEFVGLVKLALNAEGVACWNLPSAGDYVSDRFTGTASSLWLTMKARFSHTLLVPGEKTYFLASDEKLDMNIPELPAIRKIRTNYVNQYYLDIRGMRDRSVQLVNRLESIQVNKIINLDFRPAMVWYQMIGQLELLGASVRLMLIAMALLVLILVATLNPVSAALFTSGFALAAIEVFLIFGLVVFYGNISFWIGIIVALLMVGLFLGALPSSRGTAVSGYGFLLLQVILGLLTAILPPLFMYLIYKGIYGVFVALSLALLALISAMLSGRLYLGAMAIHKKHTLQAGSDNYSADMFGAATGIMTVSCFLIPVFGFQFTGGLVLLICVLSSAVGWFRISS